MFKIQKSLVIKIQAVNHDLFVVQSNLLHYFSGTIILFNHTRTVTLVRRKYTWIDSDNS